MVNEYKQIDIIHCNDLETLPIGVIIKRFFNKKVKIVYDAHEYETERHNIRGIRKTLVKNLEKYLIGYADAVMTVSDSIANEYVRLYGIKKPSLVLNTPSFKVIEKGNIFRETFGISVESTIFLYQGALNLGRGIELILDTFKSLPKDNVVVFMGYGTLEPIIKEAMDKHNNIYFHKAVPPNRVLAYTSSADFGLSLIEDSCLSYRYCLPNKMFEYIMVGIPVIVSNLPEMRKIVEEYDVGVVVNINLKKSIEEIIKMDRELLLINLKHTQKIYHWAKQEVVLMGVYNAL